MYIGGSLIIITCTVLFFYYEWPPQKYMSETPFDFWMLFFLGPAALSIILISCLISFIRRILRSSQDPYNYIAV